jgi:RecJ-like exonuclease
METEFDDNVSTVKIPPEELERLRQKSRATPPALPKERDLPCADCRGLGGTPLGGRCEWCEGTGRVCA